YRIEYGERAANRVRSDGRAIENEFFAVEAQDDGTLTVRDKRDGRVLSGLNRFVDGGDRGDEYNYCVPEEDAAVDRPSATPKVRVERGTDVQRLTVEMTYVLPSGLSQDRRSRSAATCDERIVSEITLAAGVPRIDVRTTVFNAAEDHRLRVHFPSGVQTDVSKADQHFGVVERPIALPEWSYEMWMEQPIGTYPQKAFASVDDGRAGLTIANRGLPEYEAIQTPGGTAIVVTLLRCVGWLSRSDISSRKGGAGPELRTPGAQLHGRHVFDYSIIPHAGSWEAAQAHVLAVQHVRPMRARWNRHGLGHIGAKGSFVKVGSPAFQVSGIKRAEDGDGVVVRVYNSTSQSADTEIDVVPLHGDVSMVNLNEEHIRDLPRVQGEILLNARTNEIVSLRFKR
ncbi:MAG TPA: glycoside hydrolase family 38 C-terminal domain-containing protein, partial [Dehalococcoidia bacterium]